MKEKIYKQTLQSIEALIENETDLISIMSTISCELYHSFEYFSWVGFYRLVDKQTLKVGPYQGTHGCLTINVNRGVCGTCVREKQIQIENDVSKILCHIAYSSETKSEIVLPIIDTNNKIRAVLDIDSTKINVFDGIDTKYLSEICEYVSKRYN